MIWRALKGILPCLTNLVKRKFAIQSYCSICPSKHESELHIFRHCKAAKEFWGFFPDLHEAFNDEPSSLWDWWCSVHTVLSQKLAEVWCLGLWALWLNRNARIFNEPIKDCYKLLQFVYQHVCSNISSPGSNHSSLFSLDMPNLNITADMNMQPPSNCLRLFCDASLSDDSAGLGFALFYSNRSLFMLGSKHSKPSMDIDLLEAKSVLWGLQSAFNFGAHRLEVFSDCASVALGCQKSIKDRTSSAAILNIIKEVASNFEFCSFNLIKRSCNRIADASAKFGRSLPFGAPVFFFHPASLPPNIASLYLNYAN